MILLVRDKKTEWNGSVRSKLQVSVLILISKEIRVQICILDLFELFYEIKRMDESE